MKHTAEKVFNKIGHCVSVTTQYEEKEKWEARYNAIFKLHRTHFMSKPGDNRLISQRRSSNSQK